MRHEDIEFKDEPVSEGISYDDLGRVESYVLSFESHTLTVMKCPESGWVEMALDSGKDQGLYFALPLPIIEAMMRLDLAGLAPTSGAEEE